MEQDKNLLLVHLAMENVSLTKSVNVMVTPQFYTLKKEALPVKYAYQAKKIAASLFEGLLESTGNYEYEVIREEDTWAFIAYDIQKIMTFLESKGIGKEKVAKLFFAQQALKSFTAPLGLNEKEALVVLEETLVVVPTRALSEEDSSTLAFNKSFTPKGGISLQGAVSSLLTQTQAISFAIVFLLFAGIFFVESTRYSSDEETGTEELESLYVAHPGLKTSYARKGIVDKYRTIDKSERLKRDTIKNFSKFISKGVTLKYLDIDEKSFKSSFICSNNKMLERVKSLAKKAQYRAKIIKGTKELTIEGTL